MSEPVEFLIHPPTSALKLLAQELRVVKRHARRMTILNWALLAITVGLVYTNEGFRRLTFRQRDALDSAVEQLKSCAAMRAICAGGHGNSAPNPNQRKGEMRGVKPHWQEHPEWKDPPAGALFVSLNAQDASPGNPKHHEGAVKRPRPDRKEFQP